MEHYDVIIIGTGAGGGLRGRPSPCSSRVARRAKVPHKDRRTARRGRLARPAIDVNMPWVLSLAAEE